MIANLQPYPEYKESEQAWLGRVPQHWPVLPNRALFVEVKDRGHPGEEMQADSSDSSDEVPLE